MPSPAFSAVRRGIFPVMPQLRSFYFLVGWFYNDFAPTALGNVGRRQGKIIPRRRVRDPAERELSQLAALSPDRLTWDFTDGHLSRHPLRIGTIRAPLKIVSNSLPGFSCWQDA